MCEWLSHGHWCDVKLLCGGRSFSAHRVVLASVSKFLRSILLSSPIDESPTFIVLPDFDLEAMSSVLYYIYNGEVIIPNNKLGLFFDIIQAMQIYVDCEYLPKIREVVEESTFNFSLKYDKDGKTKNRIFTLGSAEDKNKRYVNVKRDSALQSALLQYSQSDTDFHDNDARCQNGSELHRSRLGNLKSPYGDRQRNSFLRDLFIETYPRNGNVNGLTEGVLAISNECYRSPASVLSSNANGKHLSNVNALSSFGTKIIQYSSNMPKIFTSEHKLGCTTKYIGNYRNNGTSGITYPENTNKVTFIHSKSDNIPDLSNNNISIFQQPDESLLNGLNMSPFNIQHSVLEDIKLRLINESMGKRSLFMYDKHKNLKSNHCSKVIFNQVLENPWNSRTPIDYKPFRRKQDNLNSDTIKIEKFDVVNDNNNNLQAVIDPGEQLSERVSFETAEPLSYSSPLKICKDNFKCTYCNQVFTSSESLAVHIRRHSTNARYTCGECGKTFSQLRNFKYHMSIHRGTREFAATCTVCGKYFNDRGYLSSHMKIHRNRKEYKCTLCPKSFNQRVAYNMHVRIHTGVKPHVCDECGKAFSRKMLLKQHQRTHSGERPYACTHCDKRFADRSNMTLHLRLHTGVKPFSCSLCPKSFTKKHHLKSHLNFHTGSKPYSCPRCKLAFTQSSNMRTHLKKCNAPGPSSGNESQSNM